MLLVFTSVLHDFNVRWYITSGAGTSDPSAKSELNAVLWKVTFIVSLCAYGSIYNIL